jgi:phenylpropionate dioxygenase-like ring-hydroxylating dioxygenase large terminal subunit
MRNYPSNCWWVAAMAEEVTRKPLCRWLLENRVVLYRALDGAIVALEDRCAHRWAPLSQGKLIGDEIACPYHGFRYNAHGACTLVPAQAAVPAKLRVRCFPVREYGTFVWIWTGDPDKADPALLPDVPWFTNPAYLQIRRYYGEIRCNYMLIHENVLDLTHIPVLHGDTVDFDGLQQPTGDVHVTDRTVSYDLKIPDMPLDPFMATPMGVEAGTKVNFRTWGTFASPACHFSGVDITDRVAPGKRTNYNFRGMHCMTPISPNLCHYWWAQAQDYGHQIADLAEFVNPTLEATFKQDRDVLEAIQLTIDQDIRGNTAPEYLRASDRAPVAARRILKRMLDEESSKEAP